MGWVETNPSPNNPYSRRPQFAHRYRAVMRYPWTYIRCSTYKHRLTGACMSQQIRRNPQHHAIDSPFCDTAVSRRAAIQAAFAAAGAAVLFGLPRLAGAEPQASQETTDKLNNDLEPVRGPLPSAGRHPRADRDAPGTDRHHAGEHRPDRAGYLRHAGRYRPQAGAARSQAGGPRHPRHVELQDRQDGHPVAATVLRQL